MTPTQMDGMFLTDFIRDGFGTFIRNANTAGFQPIANLQYNPQQRKVNIMPHRHHAHCSSFELQLGSIDRQLATQVSGNCLSGRRKIHSFAPLL
jgi:hypothetical protein